AAEVFSEYSHHEAAKTALAVLTYQVPGRERYTTVKNGFPGLSARDRIKSEKALTALGRASKKRKTTASDAAEYVDAKQGQNVVDYDDLLLYWAEMMADVDLAGEISQRFDHVLVDEYQDTNGVQAKILMRLKPAGHGVTVVGDDAQSIYSFRA